jgi:hypothetical protein
MKNKNKKPNEESQTLESILLQFHKVRIHLEKLNF